MIDRTSSVRELRPISAAFDPWDPIRSLQQYNRHMLTSVEFTVSNLCNMRCEHCAVGYSLTMSEGDKLPLNELFRRLDEVEQLETISITGGEPSYSEKTVKEYMIPLLQYARDRGVYSQLNSNITLDYSRYEAIAPFLDVMHISFNYLDAEDYHQVGFARADRSISREVSGKLYDRMVDNAIKLSKGGLFVSAESMINYRTHEKLDAIHKLIVEMGCKRHEVHPMYASAFAEGLPMLSLEQLRAAIDRLLDARDESVWMLFGTLPFFACNVNEEDQRLLRKLREANQVTIRNDPDGRSRLNVNTFTGDVYVTDFAAVPPLGNISQDKLVDIFDSWLDYPLAKSVNCYCPEVSCCGPNLLVADTYYKDVHFPSRKAII
jgi:radical SAM/CxCxxxxC motif protein YfkAB